MTATISPEVLVHQLFGAFLLPPFVFLLPLLFGLWLKRRRPRVGAMFIAAAILLAYVLSIPRTAMWLSAGLERYPVVQMEEMAKVQAIVVQV